MWGKLASLRETPALCRGPREDRACPDTPTSCCQLSSACHKPGLLPRPRLPPVPFCPCQLVWGLHQHPQSHLTQLPPNSSQGCLTRVPLHYCWKQSLVFLSTAISFFINGKYLLTLLLCPKLFSTTHEEGETFVGFHHNTHGRKRPHLWGTPAA